MYSGANLRGHSGFYHGNAEHYSFRGTLSITPRPKHNIFPTTITYMDFRTVSI